MKRLKINVLNEVVGNQVFDKALELGYEFFRGTGRCSTAKTIFLEEDGIMTHLTHPPEDFFSGTDLKEVKEHLASYPIIEAEDFLNK